MVHAEFTDARGLSLNAESSAAAARFDALLEDFYYYRPQAPALLDSLLQEFPEFVLAHLLKGYSHMSEGMLDAHPKAQAQLDLAEALPANARERLHMTALRAWIAQDTDARAAAWEQILAEWPLDLLAFRQYTGALFWSGAKRRQATLTTAVKQHWDAQIPGYAHVLSSHAFAMEEVGEYAEAERYAREALAIQPQDLWALHCMAHVFEMQGRFDEGIQLLGDAGRFLDDYNLFRGHVWWHLALFKLSLGRTDEVLDLFDREIYPRSSPFYLDVQNGVSMLVRLECQGVDVGLSRWERLAQAAEPTATQCTLWFTAMHHVMALARCGRESSVRATLDYLDAAGRASRDALLAHDLGEAAAAFYQGNPGAALERMLAVREQQGNLGASHAQQDLYDQFKIAAALELRDWPRVRELLDARLSVRVGNGLLYQDQSVDQVRDTATLRAALRWQTP